MKHEPIVFYNRADQLWYATCYARGTYPGVTCSWTGPGRATEAGAQLDARKHALLSGMAVADAEPAAPIQWLPEPGQPLTSEHEAQVRQMIAEAVQGQPKRRVVSFWLDAKEGEPTEYYAGCDDGSIWWRSYGTNSWHRAFTENPTIPQD